MKQIILKSRDQEDRLAGVCPGRLACIWGFYGLAVAALWQFAGPSPWAQAAVWGVAALAALGLLIGMAEV